MARVELTFNPCLVSVSQGISISGLTADARSLCKYMRTECLQHKYVYESPVTVQRLVVDVADKCQGCTQGASGRPFGVGLLIAGVDQTGPHIYYNCPSGNYYEYKAMTIGARSQVRVLCIARKRQILGLLVNRGGAPLQALKSFLRAHMNLELVPAGAISLAQAAKTYMEKHYATFEDCDLPTLVRTFCASLLPCRCACCEAYISFFLPRTGCLQKGAPA